VRIVISRSLNVVGYRGEDDFSKLTVRYAVHGGIVRELDYQFPSNKDSSLIVETICDLGVVRVSVGGENAILYERSMLSPRNPSRKHIQTSLR
jgi:hypothetical protein